LSGKWLAHEFRGLRFLVIFFATVTILLPQVTLGQSTGDYQTRGTGNWNSTFTWQTYTGGNWVNATTYPGQNAGTGVVTIRNGNTVTLNISPANTIGALVVSDGSGGTFNIGNSTTPRTLNVAGGITVGTGGTVAVNNNSTTHFLNFGGDLTVNGSFDLRRDANSLCDATMNGIGTQTISGSGTTIDFNSLTISAGTTKLLSQNITINANLTVDAGTFDLSSYTANNVIGNGTMTVAAGATMRIDGGNSLPTNYSGYTIDPASTIEYYGNAQNVTAVNYGNLTFSGSGTKILPGGTTAILGNWTNNGATITATGSTINFNGAGLQTIGGSSASTFNNLRINNASGITLSAPVSVAGTLTLTSGIVTTSSTNLITITNTSTASVVGASASSYINGPLAMTLLPNIGVDGTTYSFPVGDLSNYRPMNLVNIRTGASSPVIQVTESASGATTGDGTSITGITGRNWYVQTTSGNFTSATIQLTETGLVPRSLIGKSTAQSGIYSSVGGTSIGATITSGQAVSSFPVYFALGTSPTRPLYSYQSGDWNNLSTWTNDPSGTLWLNSRLPGIADSVVILNGRTITISSNNKNVDALTLKAGGVLDIQSTNGHNFGTVSGQGSIKLSSNTFPGGTYTNFVASSGGTIEYYNLNGISLSTTQLTYNNLIVSNYSANVYTTYFSNTTNPTTYTINGNFSLKNYSTGSETFYFGNQTASDNLINMTVYGNFSVDPNCNVRVSNFATGHTIPDPTNNTTPYPVHTLNLYGNLTNNGSVRFTGLPSPVANAYYTLATTSYGGTNYGDVQVFFYGAANNNIICNGTTDFYRLIVAKGADNTYSLEVSSSDVSHFALYAPNAQGGNNFNGGPEGYGYGAYYKALFIHYGTLKLDANINIPSLTEGGQDFNIIPTAGLWVNGANVSTTVSGLNGTGYQAATLYGTLRVSSGQFSTGDAAGIVLGTLGTPMIMIEGTGVLDVSQAWTNAGGSNLMSYVQTGGTANFRMQGENHAGPMLGLNSPNASFVMSGGTINFTSNTFIDNSTNYNIMDIGCQTGYYHVTGGTVNLNLPGSATSDTANSTVPFYNLNISRGSGTGNVSIQWNTPGTILNVVNDLSVGANSVLNLGTSGINLAVGHNFTLNGTYTPATGAANVTTFNGTGTQLFSNAGTITGGLNNLTVTNSSNTFIVSNNLTVNRILTIDNNSVLNDSGRVITVNGNIVLNGMHTSSVTTGSITLSGTATQTISGNGAGVFNNLTLNKTGGSVTVTANVTVLGNLRLAGATAGAWNIFNIGSYNLSLGPNAMVYSDMATGTAFANNRMIQTNGVASDGGISKSFSNTAAFLFPFGFGTYYQPASIQYSSAPTTFGIVTTRPVNARHPLAQGTTNALTCYWKTSSTGFSGVPAGTVKHLYYYAQNFVQGTETSYIPAYYDGVSSWVTPSGSVDVTNNIISFTALNASDGEFTAGLSTAFITIPTLYSFVTGNWNSAATWSTNRNTYIAGGTPTSSTLVYVCNGNTVTTTVAAFAGNLIIETGSTVDLGTITGHNFGAIANSKVSGNGKLRIASNNYFPTGDWGNFLGSNGGTVEYYQKAAGTLNLPTTYTSSGGGTANITSYSNLIVSPYNGSNIILPNTNLTIYGNLTVGYSAGGGTTNCITQINAGATTTTLEVHGTITVNQYGILQYMNSTANIPQNVVADSDINIASGGALQVRNAGNSVANTLTVYGNIVNNGTLDLDPNTGTNAYYSNLQFTGSFSRSLTSTSTPTRTRLYNIIVNKGTTLDSIVNVSIDPTGFQMGGGGLSLQNGTFRLTTPVAMTISTGGFTIPVSGGLSANGGTLNLITGAASADVVLKGRLEVLSGTVNVGPSISSGSGISASISYSAAGSPSIIISGGALNVYSQIRRDTVNNSGSLNYTQTGGTVTVGGMHASDTRAPFEVVNTGSQFVMSGGSIIIANGNINMVSPFDLDIEPDISTVSGGTIQFGLAGVTPNRTPFRFETAVPLWNLTLEASTNASAIQEIYNSTLLGNLTIGGTSGYYNANGLDLEIGGNLVNNNTDASTGINAGGFQAGSSTQTTSFLGTADQTMVGTSSNRTNFANLEIATASSHTTFLSTGACTIVVNGDLTLTSGTLNDNGNSIYLLNNVNNNATHVSPNATSGGMIFAGASNQGITGSGSGVFGNIEINNGGNGVNMTDNSTINGQLKFTNGYLYIDDYALTLGPNATAIGTINASNLILLNGVLSDKGVKKILPSGASSFTFPIGANGKYTPASYSFSSNNNSGATIKIIPVDGLHPSINTDSVSNYLNYYWNVSTTGFSSSYNLTQTYTYITADTVGSPAHIERYDNSTSKWSTVAGTITPPTFTFASSSFIDGSYTIGDLFVSLPMLYSIMSGSWFNGAIWSTDTTTMVPYGKIPSGNPVFIRRQDSVALSANSANATSVVIHGILDAENTTFHNIGQVSGDGKIMISSTSSGYFAFPGGTYDGFFANPASTVEFYGSINGRLPLDPGNTAKPYQNVIFSGTSTKYISSVDIKVDGNLTIQSGSKLDNTQYDKDVYILGNWMDNNTSTAGFIPGSGTVYFSDSTTAQRIIMSNGSMTETFYNFGIDNPSGVTISTGSVAVSHQLILASGNITTSSSDSLIITNTDTGAVVGGGVNSFVNGPLKKQILNGSNFQFPVGDAVSSSRNRFGYVSVSQTSTSGTQTWTAQFFDKNPTPDGYNISNMTSPVKSVNYSEYWKITGPAGGTAKVTLSWDQYSGMSSSLTTRALSLVAEWGTPVASSWNSVGNVISDFGQDSGTVATSTLINLAGTQVFTIGATTAAIAALITSIQTGMWNNPSVWNVGRAPSAIDTVVITSPYIVTLNTTSTISKFAINNGGTYNDSTFTLNVTGNVTLNGTWTGSGKLSLKASGGTLYGTGTATGSSTLEVATGSVNAASSANFTLKNVSILAGDTLNNYGSVTIDSVNGAAASSILNNLPGATLTINRSLLVTGTLSAGTPSNTVVYSGSAAQTIKPTTYNNVLVTGSGAKTITSGTTTISNGNMELRSGPVLTIGSGATVTTLGTGKIVLDTNSSYINLSSSAPLILAQTEIKGHDEWRMLAAPDNVTVGSMFANPFVTQGFTGSTYPTLQPNLLWWDETSQGTSLQAWRQPSNSSDTVKLGRGYMYYVFNGTEKADSSGSYSDTLPLTMSSLGVEHPLTTAFNFGVTATTRSGGGAPDTTFTDTAAADFGWNLAGNPTPSTINWNSASGWTKTNVDGTIYVWDPADTTGGYKTWNGTTGNLGSGLIAPFQAFWVKANNINPVLSCDNGVKSSGGVFLGKIAQSPTGGTPLSKMAIDTGVSGSSEKTSEDSTSSPPVLSLDLSADGLHAQAYLMFSSEGKLSYDPYDAFSLVPLSNNYLIFYSVAGNGQPAMQIQDLPDTGFADPFTLPLYVGGTTGGKPLDGSFTLRWNLQGGLPSGWKIVLMDDYESKAYTMTSTGELAFQYSTPTGLIPSSSNFLQKTTGNSNHGSVAALPWPVVRTVPSSRLSKAASVVPRFRLIVSAKDLAGYLPSTPQLAQNYPNPFNPSTNIQFSLPARARVSVDIFNVLGQRVATLADEEFSAGTHTIVWNPRTAASGVYFCRMLSGSSRKIIKMMFLK
jgi:fibronectin-binding autotransporter adhesin